VEKGINYKFAFCAAVVAGGEGRIYFNFKFDMFYTGSRDAVDASKFNVAP
jgi:hypothetical protein